MISRIKLFGFAAMIGFSASALSAQSAVDSIFGDIPPATSITLTPAASKSELPASSQKDALKEAYQSVSNTANPSTALAKDPVLVKEQIAFKEAELVKIQEQIADALAAENYSQVDRLSASKTKILAEISDLEASVDSATGSVQTASADTKPESGGGGGGSNLLPIAAGVGAAALGATALLSNNDSPASTSSSPSASAPRSPYADKYGNVTEESLSEFIKRTEALEEGQLAEDGRTKEEALADANEFLQQARATNSAFTLGEQSFLCEGSGVQSCGVDDAGLMAALNQTLELQDRLDKEKEELEEWTDRYNKAKDPTEKANLRNTREQARNKFNATRAELDASQKKVRSYASQFAQKAKSGNYAETSMAKNSTDLINAVISAMNKRELSDQQRAALGGSFDQLAQAHKLFGITPIKTQNIASVTADMLNQGTNLGSLSPNARQIGIGGTEIASSASGGGLFDSRGGDGNNICLRDNC